MQEIKSRPFKASDMGEEFIEFDSIESMLSHFDALSYSGNEPNEDKPLYVYVCPYAEEILGKRQLVGYYDLDTAENGRYQSLSDI